VKSRKSLLFLQKNMQKDFMSNAAPQAFIAWTRTLARQRDKSLLVLFFRKQLLSSSKEHHDMHLRLATALCLLAPFTAHANLLKDPSFEKPVVPAGNLSRFTNGQKIGAWTVTGASGNVDVISSTFTYDGFTYNAKAGKQWLDLTGASQTATGVAQTFATITGATYLLTFSVGSVYDTGGVVGTTSTVHVYNGSTLLQTVIGHGKKGTTTQHWTVFKITFTATSAKTTLSFINGDPSNDTDCGIDAVSVVPAANVMDSKMLSGFRNH
jgi:hypothetical protein